MTNQQDLNRRATVVAGNENAKHPFEFPFEQCDREHQAKGERFRKQYKRQFNRPFNPVNYTYLGTVFRNSSKNINEINLVNTDTEYSEKLSTKYSSVKGVQCICGQWNYRSFLLQNINTGRIINVGHNCRKAVWNASREMIRSYIEVLKINAEYIDSPIVFAYAGVPHRLLPQIAKYFNKSRELADNIIIPAMELQLTKPLNEFGEIERESVKLLSNDEVTDINQDTDILQLPNACLQVMKEHLGLRNLINKTRAIRVKRLVKTGKRDDKLITYKDLSLNYHWANISRPQELLKSNNYDELSDLIGKRRAYRLIEQYNSDKLLELTKSIFVWNKDWHQRRKSANYVLRQLKEKSYNRTESIEAVAKISGIHNKYLNGIADYLWLNESDFRFNNNEEPISLFNRLVEFGLEEYWAKRVLIDLYMSQLEINHLRAETIVNRCLDKFPPLNEVPTI